MQQFDGPGPRKQHAALLKAPRSPEIFSSFIFVRIIVSIATTTTTTTSIFIYSFAITTISMIVAAIIPVFRNSIVSIICVIVIVTVAIAIVISY